MTDISKLPDRSIDDRLLLQALQELREDVRAMRAALDRQRDDHAAAVTEHAEKLQKDRADIDLLLSDRETERRLKTGLVMTTLGAIAAALGGFITFCVERLMPHAH
jgi:hypothetical protein